MTREVSRENSQDALDKDPRAVRPDMAKQPDPMTLSIQAPKLTAITLMANGATLMTIKPDGTVEAPSIEAANAAGKVFVDSVRHHLKQLIAEEAK